MAYQLELTQYAEDFLAANVTTERVLLKIEEVANLIAAYPNAGVSYNPDYVAARPPFPCRYFPVGDTPFTLYYIKDDGKEKVVVFDVEWSAGDPRRRFEEISTLDW